MPRWLEAAKVTAYAVVLQVAALAIGLPLFVGLDSVPRHLGFAGLLIADGTVCVLFVVLLALRHGPVDSAARGARLGLWAAAGFYAVILLVVGVIPSLIALRDGHAQDALDYFGVIVRTVALGSYGLPILVGAGGGALYGWLWRRRAQS